jgi:hypothetical protein
LFVPFVCFVVPSSPRLLVVEKTGCWAAALRRAAGSRELPLVEVRSLEQAERELLEHPSSIAAVEISAASLVRVATRVAAWRMRFAGAAHLLLADEELVPLDSMLRETGAVHVLFSPRDLHASVRLIRRHLDRAPRPALSLEESVLSRLPWQAARPG